MEKTVRESYTELAQIMLIHQANPAGNIHGGEIMKLMDNAAFVAACNRVGDEPTYSFFGDSLVVGPRGVVHTRLEGEDPRVAIATVDLDEARRYQEETQLLQARQPRSYREVVKMY